MTEQPDQLLRQVVDERFGPPVDERRPNDTRACDAAGPGGHGGVARTPHEREEGTAR